MNIVALKNQVGSLIGPLHTVDAVDSTRLTDMMNAEIDLSMRGLLDADDFRRLKAILEKYVGASVTTNQAGSSRLADADAGRASGARVRAAIDNNRSVAEGYRNFWEKKNAELATSIRR
jgi:hypothetical protein